MLSLLLALACSPPPPEGPAPPSTEPTRAPPPAPAGPVALPDTPLVAKDCGLWYLEPRPVDVSQGDTLGIGGLGIGGTGQGGGGAAQGLGGLGTKGIGGSSGYGSGGGSFGPPPTDPFAAPAPTPAPSSAPGSAAADEKAAAALPGEDGEPAWGAEIHLSNDDSMSLASAQRLLWAASNDVRIEPQEVRPHELLNYFHFATAEVPADRTFSVKGSALADVDGKLTLALSVKGAEVPRRPLDLTFVLDRSGSMYEEGRMDFVKRGLRLAVPQLARGDRLDLVLFDHEMCTALESFVVGRDDPALLDKAIAALAPRGATNLDIGLHEAYRLANARTEPGRDRRVVLLTDALVNEGELDPNVLAQAGAGYQERGIRLTGIGVGREFSDVVLDKLTEAGHGPYLFLGSEAVVDRFFGEGFDAMTRTLAHDVRFSVDLPDSLAQERFYGEESSLNEADITPIDYQSGNGQLFLQDLAVRDGQVAPKDPVTLRIRWKDPTSGDERTESWTATVGELLDSSPADIRKARALMAWSDMAYARATSADACGAPLATFRTRLAAVKDDTEATWLGALTDSACRELGPWTRVPPPRDPRTTASMRFSKLEVEGIGEPLVQAVLRRSSNQFRYCHQRVLTRNPGVGGDVALTFGIDAEGHPVEPKVVSNTLSDTTVAACAQGRLARMLFPAPKGKGAKVELTLTFTP